MDNKSQIPISVIVTTYNAAAFIRETIDSILEQTFQNFELLIGDDESEDNTCEIIESYHDSRIRLVRCKHDFIDTENRMLNEASGKYIARLDHDDRMLPDRLKTQYEYMERHHEIDVLGGGMICFGNETGIMQPLYGHQFTVSDMIKANYILNPTVMIRRNTIEKYHLLYNRRYLYADDYGMWAEMVKLGLHLENLPIMLTEYRISSTQTSSVYAKKQAESVQFVVSDLEDWAAREEMLWAKKHPVVVPHTSNQLTLVIPFLNEGEEVINTVKSALQFAGNKVDIIAINDHSNDGFPYRKMLEPYYNVTYIYNKERIGVARSRDFGVNMCRTPYFLLLDAHMRFYDGSWVNRIISLLEQNDRQLLCSQSKFLQKDENGIVSEYPNVIPAYGAYQPLIKGDMFPDITWNWTERKPGYRDEPIAFVLGAGYAASRRYWHYLRGLEGLVYYGSDEAYISLKVWLEGGQCVLLKDVIIGHIYRTRSAPYKMYNEMLIYNNLLISYLLYPQSMRIQSFCNAACNNWALFQIAFGMFEKRKVHIDDLLKYYHQIFKRNYREIISLHRILQPEQRKKINLTKSLLPIIAENVIKQVRGNGICEGNMAAVIWLAMYSRYTHNPDYLLQAQDVFLGIIDEIEKCSITWNFHYGLCGIGWGILYLKEAGFILKNADDILSIIDNVLLTISPKRLIDYSFDSGMSGLLCYVTARQRSKPDFDIDFLSELKESTLKMLSKTIGRVQLYYGKLFLDILSKGIDNNDIELSFSSWMDYPSFIPKEQKYWRYNMSNILGASMFVMLLKQKYDYETKIK